MRYYVSYTEMKDGDICSTVTGNRIKRGSDLRRCAFFVNHKMLETPSPLYTEREIVENLFNAPMTKRQAVRFMNRIKKSTRLSGEFRIREYPDEMPLSQFDAFIRW